MSAHASIPSDIRSWAEIDLEAIRQNARTARGKLPTKSGLQGVVKANGYGHGVEEVARALSGIVESFGVANLHEGREIGELGLGKDILLLGPCLPSERKEAIGGGFICTVSSAQEAVAYDSAAEEKPALINFKIDTGMGRIGCWQDRAVEEMREILRLKKVSVRMIGSHLPVADEDDDFTVSQLSQFNEVSSQCRELAPQAAVHVLNSAGALRFPQHGHDFARVGLMLYGSAYPPEYQHLLRPALTWKARVVLVRTVGRGRSVSYGRTFIARTDIRTATLPIGYADGFPRQVSGKGAAVLIGGRRCPVLGRVTMDQIVVDVSNCPEVKEGDEAVIVGKQGGEEILAKELADYAGTISWDIFTGIKARINRYYLNR